MYEKYFKQLIEECLIRNRSLRTAEAYISNNKPMEELSLQDARLPAVLSLDEVETLYHLTFVLLL